MTHTIHFARSTIATLLVIAIASVLVPACGGDDKESSTEEDTPPGSYCTPLGDSCNSASDPCCYSDGAETKCMNATCQVCAATGSACGTDDDCCLNRNCYSGTCCNRPRAGCSSDEDCCSGVCGTSSCCLPSGFATHSILDCCSQHTRDIYCEHPVDGTRYVCETQCT
jgi:hypothetical protein